MRKLDREKKRILKIKLKRRAYTVKYLRPSVVHEDNRKKRLGNKKQIISKIISEYIE